MNNQIYTVPKSHDFTRFLEERFYRILPFICINPLPAIKLACFVYQVRRL